MIPAELLALGITQEYGPNAPPFPAMTVNVMGRKSRGKTHFAFGAPGPIVYIAFDPGQEGVREKFQAKKQIMPYFPKIGPNPAAPIVPLGAEITQAMARAVLGQFMLIYHKCFELGPPFVRTIVVDQGNQFSDLVLIAMYGRVERIPPLQYGPYYQYLKKTINYPHEGAQKPVNVIWTHPMKDEYEGTDDKDAFGKKTGNDVMRGYKDFGYEVDFEILLERQMIGLSLGEFQGKIIKSRYAPMTENIPLVGPQVDFATLAHWMMPRANEIYPGCWNDNWVPPAGSFR